MKTKEKDYRIGQKVIATIELEDGGQDFTELDVLENGVILGYSPMFSHGRLSLLGIGSLDGMDYFSFKDFKVMKKWKLDDLSIYMKETGEKDPLPWKAQTLKYRVAGVRKPTRPNRFL